MGIRLHQIDGLDEHIQSILTVKKPGGRTMDVEFQGTDLGWWFTRLRSRSKS